MKRHRWLLLLGLLIAALAVAGCGGKGGLDLPPAASAAAQQDTAARPQERESRSIGADITPTGPRSSNSRSLPPAPPPKRDLPIDFLLN